MRPRKTSQVGNQFHGTAPPPKISCQWIPPDHTYMQHSAPLVICG